MFFLTHLKSGGESFELSQLQHGELFRQNMIEDIAGEYTSDTLSFPHFYKSDYVYHSCIQFIVLPPEKILVRVSIRMGKVYKIQNLWCFIIFIDECKTRFLKCSSFCIKIRDVTRICLLCSDLSRL